MASEQKYRRIAETANEGIWAIDGQSRVTYVSTKFTGRGLGLAVVAGVVKAHAGAIAVTSQPGGGTAVRVYLPIGEQVG